MEIFKKTLFIGLFLLSFQLNAQIEKEIKTYVDSTEILFVNGRKLLLEEIQLFNYPKATEIFNFLEKNADSKNCKFDVGYNIIAHYNYAPFKGNMLYAKLSLNLGLGTF